MKFLNGQKILETFTPTNKSELRRNVFDLYKTGTPMTFIGGGTKKNFGQLYNKNLSVIYTNELNKIIDYNPSDLTITVESGMKVSHLVQELKKNNQFLGYRLPLVEQSTIGGSTSYGYSGTYRFNDIHIRDSIIGLEAVDHNGNYVKSGGQVVKNVSGYDAHKLFIGTSGSFGPIYSLSFKVYPIPNNNTVVDLCFDNINDAYQLAKKYVLYNWNIPRLSIVSSNSEKMYKLSIDIVGTNSTVNKISNSIYADYKKFTQYKSELSDRLFNDNFGYALEDKKILIKFTSNKNNFFLPLSNYLKDIDLKYNLMINPIFGFASLIIDFDDNLNKFIDNLKLIITKHKINMNIEGINFEQHNLLINENKDNNILNRLTKSFKDTYDNRNLFSPGKIYDN
ncbi:MAG: FAD-binding oxidoreductase [Dehalococcoidia bacterium]